MARPACALNVRSMPRTIIAGVDGRDGGRDAVALGAHLADLTGARLVLAHAFPYDVHPGRDAHEPYRAALLDEAMRVLAADRAALSVEAELTPLADSKPARGLHRLAADRAAGLIVVGSSHRGAVGRALLGDVATGVLHGAPCPVAVAPAGWAHSRRESGVIGVGYAATAECEAALRDAVALAAARGGSLRVMQVVEPPALLSPGYAYAYDWSAIVAESRGEAEKALAAKVGTLEVPAAAEVVVGLAREELEALSTEVDLLVIGSRGYGPVRRVLLGSTGDWLSRHAACPVIVHPRGEAAADDAPVVAAAAAAG
jgi:nucleotide-binding universal stress UspA family protein